MRAVRIVNVFSDGPWSGNPLAVVPEAAGLSAAQMQGIAREMNLSETIFLTRADTRATVAARIFTPAAEIPLAGHPVLGGAWVAARDRGVQPDAAGALCMQLPGGEVRVSFEGAAAGGRELVWMEFPPVSAGAWHPPEVAAGLLGLSPAAVDPDPGPREMAAGVDYLLVPLQRAADVVRCSPVAERYREWVGAGRARGIYAFAPDEGGWRVRMFAPALGVPEDPATGSGAACLGAYLVERRGTAAVEGWVRQGAEVGRPSRIRLCAARGDAGVQVRVGGCVRPFLRGWIEAV